MQHPERVQAVREFRSLISKKQRQRNLGILFLILAFTALLKIIH